MDKKGESTNQKRRQRQTQQIGSERSTQGTGRVGRIKRPDSLSHTLNIAQS